MHKIAWVSAPLAPIAMIGGWTYAATLQPASYDATRDTISALAAHGATDRWVMTTGLAVLGVCHVVTALGLIEARPTGRVLLGAGGVCALLVAVFATPSSLHFPVATASFVLLAAWAGFAALPSRTAGWVAAVLLGLLLAGLGLALGSAREGLVERVVAGGESLWPLVVVVAVTVRARRPAAAGAT